MSDDVALALLHAQTFSHHPVLCAAGLAAIRYLDAHGLVERCAMMGAELHRKLQALREHTLVGDVRGRGLLAGIEFVRDRDTRVPYPRSAKVAERFTEAAQEAGLIVWPNTGHADGTDGDLVMVAGYPARTNRHRTAQEVTFAVEQWYPERIAFLDEYIAALRELGKQSEELAIKAHTWIARFENALKYYRGTLANLKKGALAEAKQAVPSPVPPKGISRPRGRSGFRA